MSKDKCKRWEARIWFLHPHKSMVEVAPSYSRMEGCLQLHVKTHKNLTMGPSFFKPFFDLAGTFFRSAEIRTKETNAGAGCKFSWVWAIGLSRKEKRTRDKCCCRLLQGARENLTRSNLVGDMKQTDKFVKGQLFNLQRTWQQSVSHIWILQVVA